MQKGARRITEINHRFRESFSYPKHDFQNLWIQFNMNDLLQEIVKINRLCYIYFDAQPGSDDWKDFLCGKTKVVVSTQRVKVNLNYLKTK